MKKITKAFLIITVMFCTAALVTCSADRNNKWDPGADNYVGDKDDDGDGDGDYNYVWSAPEQISSNDECDMPKVAMGAQGNAIAVWENYSNGSIEAREFIYNNPNKGWQDSTIEDIDANWGSNPNGVDIDMKDDGSAVAVWYELMGNYRIYSNFFNPSSGGWQGAVYIDDDSQQMYGPHVVLNEEGEAVCFWIYFDGSFYQGKASVNMGGWGNLTDNISYDSALAPAEREINQYDVAMDDSGNALLVWTTGDDMSIRAKKFNGGSWEMEKYIEDTADNVGSVKVAANGNGDAIIAWGYYYYSDPNYYYYIQITDFKLSDNFSGWTPNIMVFSDTTSTDMIPYPNPALALNDNGQGIVAWEADGHIYGRWFGSLNPEPPSAVQLDGSGGNCYNPKAGIDNMGNAIVVWTQSADGVFASRFDVNSSQWTGNSRISNDGIDATDLDMDMDDNGTATVVWPQMDGADEHIWAARYD